MNERGHITSLGCRGIDLLHNDCQIKYYSFVLMLREIVKTVVHGEDPPYIEKDDGIFLYPIPPILKDGILVV